MMAHVINLLNVGRLLAQSKYKNEIDIKSDMVRVLDSGDFEIGYVPGAYCIYDKNQNAPRYMVSEDAIVMRGGVNITPFVSHRFVRHIHKFLAERRMLEMINNPIMKMNGLRWMTVHRGHRIKS